MRHHAFGANGAKRKVAVSAALGIAVAAGLCATRPAVAQTFYPPIDAPLGDLNTIGVKEVHNAGGVAGQDTTRTRLLTPDASLPTTARLARYFDPVINIDDSDSTGNF